MPSGRAPQRSGFRLLRATGAACATGAIVASLAFAAASKPVVLSDPGDDAGGELDITRASLQRASDGRLRAVLSFAAKVTPKTLLAGTGPPGSACLRVWTGPGADPKATRPDRLVCVTARSADELRGGVYEAGGPDLPKRIADAGVKLNASGRSVVIRFTQSSLGRPQRIQFAFESTRPGCERPSCVDTVPDGGAVRAFKLR
jgi:hypothetical protein